MVKQPMMALFHGSKYMKTGKISENVLKRSVLKRCKSGREEVAQGPGIGQDCAIVRSEGQKFYTGFYSRTDGKNQISGLLWRE